jgi:hypothetical protein
MQPGCTSLQEVRNDVVYCREARVLGIIVKVTFCFLDAMLAGHDGSLRVWSVADRHCVFEQTVRLSDKCDVCCSVEMLELTCVRVDMLGAGAPAKDGRSSARGDLSPVTQLHRYGRCGQYNKDLSVRVWLQAAVTPRARNGRGVHCALMTSRNCLVE